MNTQKHMEQHNLLSVITVNYNGYNDTCNLIESWIDIIKSYPYEFIIIDNGSTIDEGRLIKEKFPQTIVHRSEKNLGFAGANNIGIKMSKGNLLFFLNNDTIIIKDSLSIFINKLNEKNIAGISPLILNNDKDFSIQYAGYSKLSKISLRNKVIKKIDIARESNKTEFLHGAAMLFKKEAINKVGLINEEYFLYYEELDWCEQFKKNGYDLYFEPSFCIIHKNGATIGIDSPKKAYYLSRNRLLFAYNNRNHNNLFFIISYHLLIAYPFHIIQALLNGKIKIAQAVIKGTIDFFKISRLLCL